MSKHMFYVAISPSGRATASCVDEPNTKWGKQLVREFYRENVGREIRRVNGDEMVRLMSPATTTDETMIAKAEPKSIESNA